MISWEGYTILQGWGGGHGKDFEQLLKKLKYYSVKAQDKYQKEYKW